MSQEPQKTATHVDTPASSHDAATGGKGAPTAHTELPWGTAGIANPNTNPRMSLWGPRSAHVESGEWIAKDITPENVEFILRAVNSYYGLVAALQDVDVLLDAVTLRTDNGVELVGPTLNDVRAVSVNVQDALVMAFRSEGR